MSKRYCQTLELKNDPELIKKYVEAHDREHHWHEIREGIVVHDYGPHIFHTSMEEVWKYVNRYASFYSFINAPLACYKGELYHMPFNMNTFYALWGTKTGEEARKKIEEEKAKENVTSPSNLEEQAIAPL